MSRAPYITSVRLREIVRDTDRYVDNGEGDRKMRRVAMSIGRSARAELTRRHLADHCEICGYDGDACSCADNPSPVLVNEYEPDSIAQA